MTVPQVEPKKPRKAKSGQEIYVGPRLRHARMVKGLRLADLAAKADCSESLLSKIENNKATPSLSLLHRLGQALGTNVGWFLTSDSEEPQIIVRREDRLSIEFHQYEIEGTIIERLAPHFDGQLLQAHLFVVNPGGHSLESIQHEGEDFGYIIEGEVELMVSGVKYSLRKGDTFQFRSEKPHGYRNAGDKIARILWVNTPPTY